MQDCTAMDSGTCDAARHLLATAFVTTRVGEPDAGNLHVRFDEGERRCTSLPTRLPPRGGLVPSATCLFE